MSITEERLIEAIEGLAARVQQLEAALKRRPLAPVPWRVEQQITEWKRHREMRGEPQP